MSRQFGTDGVVSWEDGNIAAHSAIPLSGSASDWDDYVSNFGEGTPALSSLNQLSSGAAGAKYVDIVAKVNEAAGVDKGQAVYISGATGQFAQVSLCDNTNEAKRHFLGIVTEAKTDGQSVSVRLFGELDNFDTATPGWSDGETLYMSTGGDLTDTRPTSGAVIHIGHVSYSHVSQGKIVITKEDDNYMAAASGQNLDIRMGDSAGATKVSFEDYADNEVASIDSNGNFDFDGNISVGGSARYLHSSSTGSNTHTDIDAHINSSSNPHSTTMQQAYDDGSSVTVSGADVEWTINGQYSYIIDMNSMSGSNDGFFIEDGSHYWRLTHTGPSDVNLDAALNAITYTAEYNINFNSTSGSIDFNAGSEITFSTASYFDEDAVFRNKAARFYGSSNEVGVAKGKENDGWMFAVDSTISVGQNNFIFTEEGNLASQHASPGTLSPDPRLWVFDSGVSDYSYWTHDALYFSGGGTITGATLVTPYISDYTNATHDHTDDVNGGELVHADMTLLGADDHTQYVLASGTRAFSGVVVGVTPTFGSHLTTKDYVDGLVQGLSWRQNCDHSINYVKAGAPIGTAATNGEKCLDTTNDKLHTFGGGVWDAGSSSSTGDRYINMIDGDDTSGDSGTYTADDKIREYDGADYDENTPTEGWATWVEDLDTRYVYNGTDWVKLGETVSHNNTAGLQGGTASEYYHLTDTQHTDLTDSGETSLHTHDHGALNGKSDDDHTQYALLAGRGGGQILYGGDAASEVLILRGTTHGTPGYVHIGAAGSPGHSPTGVYVVGQNEFDGISYFDANLNCGAVVSATNSMSMGTNNWSLGGGIYQSSVATPLTLASGQTDAAARTAVVLGSTGSLTNAATILLQIRNGSTDLNYFDVYSRLVNKDNSAIYFGTDRDAQMRFNTDQTIDAMMLTVDATSNNWIFCQNADSEFDFAHGVSTYPTWFFHSAAQSTTQWMSAAHTGTAGRISTGLGNLELYPTSGSEVTAGYSGSARDFRAYGAIYGEGTIYGQGSPAFHLNDNLDLEFGTGADIKMRYRTPSGLKGLFVGVDMATAHGVLITDIDNITSQHNQPMLFTSPAITAWASTGIASAACAFMWHDGDVGYVGSGYKTLALVADRFNNQRTYRFDEASGGLELRISERIWSHTSALFDAAGLTDNTVALTVPTDSLMLYMKVRLNTQFAAPSMTDLRVTMGVFSVDEDAWLETTGNLTSDAEGTVYKNRGAYWNTAGDGGYYAPSTLSIRGYATATGANLNTTTAGSITVITAFLA